MAGLGDLIGGIFGGSAGKDDMKKAAQLSQETVDQLKALGVPEIEIQKIALTNPELVGQLQAENYGPSSYEQVHVDPRLKDAQMKALEQMSGLADQGLGAEDKFAIQQALRQSGAEAQAQNAATLQNAAATGTMDSGNALMSQLMAGQQSANRAQTAGMQQAAQAAEARRAALGQYGNMATAASQQDYGMKSDLAKARDAISQFNAQNRQNVNQTNLTNRQGIENQRAANANQQEMYNKGLIQQKFNNDVTKATGVANAQNNQANMYSQQGTAAAQGQAQLTGSLISGAASIGAAAAKKGS
jgi:hypothetical protein